MLLLVARRINPHEPERIDPEVLEGSASGNRCAQMATLAYFSWKVCTVALALRARCVPSHSRFASSALWWPSAVCTRALGVHTDVCKEQSSKVDVYDLQLPDEHGKITSASNLVWPGMPHWVRRCRPEGVQWRFWSVHSSRDWREIASSLVRCAGLRRLSDVVEGQGTIHARTFTHAHLP